MPLPVNRSVFDRNFAKTCYGEPQKQFFLSSLAREEGSINFSLSSISLSTRSKGGLHGDPGIPPPLLNLPLVICIHEN